MELITWIDFEKVDMRVGTVISAAKFPEARKPAYKLEVDLGDELGIRKSSAQITEQYALDELIGRQVLCVVNFPPKQIGPFISECLVCGFYTDEGVVLAEPSKMIPNGSKLG